MATCKTLDIIRSEHRRLATIINCFIGVLNDIKDRNQVPDLVLFEQVVSYLEDYLFTFHHPKEDGYLFKRLSERSRSSSTIVSRLADEHDQGQILLQRLRKNLNRYREDQRRDNFMGFYNIAMVYRDFEFHHMGTEERELLPLAERYLTSSDWQELDSIFSEHDDPVFGERVDSAFRELASKIINLAPAPHGLGTGRL